MNIKLNVVKWVNEKTKKMIKIEILKIIHVTSILDKMREFNKIGHENKTLSS